MQSLSNFSIFVFVVCSISGALGGSLRQRKSVDSFIRKITYTGKTELNQKVTVTENEARFEVAQGMNGVIDYDQKLFVYTNGRYCNVAADFDISALPSIQEIKTMIEQKTTFEKPSEKKEVRYRVSKEQTIPFLNPLAKEMCGKRKIVRVEESSGEAMERMKREVGAGEVVVIIIAIVVLGFLG